MAVTHQPLRIAHIITRLINGGADENTVISSNEAVRRGHSVMVLPAYFPETFGGAEHQTRRFAQALARRGVSVTMLAPRLKGGTPSREEEGPVLVRRFRLRAAPNLGGRHFDSFAWWCLCISSWLWRNRRRYDLIYVVHGRLHAFPATLAGRGLHKPVVVKPGRGGEVSFDLSVVRRKRLLGSFFARSIARNTTAWVANSKEIAADLMARFASFDTAKIAEWLRRETRC